MRTQHIEYLLPDYLNHRLEDDLRPGVEQHLQECAACRGELEMLRTAFREIEAHQDSGPPEGYFSTVLPRVRERLENREAKSILAHPLILRLVAPLAAGALALIIMLHLPFPANNTEAEQNPLRPIMHGVTTDELVDVVLDQAHRQSLNALGEGEASSILATRILHGEHLLADAEPLPHVGEPVLGGGMPEGLEQLSDSEIEAIIQRLGERTTL